MNDCHKSRDLCSLILDGEASQIDQRFFDGHLSECEKCRRDWLDFKASQSMLASLTRLTVSATFEDRVLADIHEAMRNNRPIPELAPAEAEPMWWQAWLPRFGLTAAGATLVAVVYLFGAGKPPREGGSSVLDPGGRSEGSIQPVVGRLEDRFPDLPPEILKSLDEESYVLDRMTVQPNSSGGSRVVAPVAFGTVGAVYVTF